MTARAQHDKKKMFLISRPNETLARVRVTSINPAYSREQAAKDLAEIDALIVEGGFKRLKPAKGVGHKPYLYRFVLADGRRFRHGRNAPLARI